MRATLRKEVAILPLALHAERMPLDGGDHSPDDTAPQPLAKRQRRNEAVPGQKRIRGRQGALKKLLDLPVDLILEICTHLDPGDLLVLSNTNKAFHSILTGESSGGLFRRARQRLGMPELLVPMTDLQYATLIFGKGCKFCGKSRYGKPEPYSRVRVCGTCLGKEFKEMKNYYAPSLNRYTPFCLLRVSSWDRTSLVRDDFRRMSKKLDARFPITASTRETGPSNRWYCFNDDESSDSDSLAYVPRRARLSIETRRTLDADWEFVESLNFDNSGDAVDTLVPNSDFQKWYLERFKLLELRELDAEALKTWLKEAETQKLQRNKQIRSGRREQIESRLEALGFNKTEFTAREFQEHLQVKSTRPLSDITWSTLVEPALRKVLEANRRKRLEKAIARQYESVVKGHTDKAHLPPPAVYVQLSSLSSLVSDVSRNPPDSLIVPASIKAAAMEQALKLVRNRREKLARAVVKAYLSLSEQETERTEARRDGGEEEEIENSHTKLTPIRQLSFTLPLLPSWIPRDQNESITASDEQVATFLNISPLARFECVECHNSFDAQGLFAHFWPPQRLRDSNWIPGFDFTACKDNRSVSLEEWISVEGFDDNVERPLVRINPEVLSLSLKLNQLFESTPLVVDPSVKLPKLRGKYSIKAKKSESLKIELRCDCPVGWRRYSSPESMTTLSITISSMKRTGGSRSRTKRAPVGETGLPPTAGTVTIDKEEVGMALGTLDEIGEKWTKGKREF
ncbi:hypothetical protein JCM5350_002460 [Sporobolomyces pararoseus]